MELPIILLAGSVGVWLFYVQHQFEMTFWAHEDGWSFEEAALHGSSHYDLPGILRWFTANIGVHHVHHLCSRIPFYRLLWVLRDYPELRGVSRLTLLQSLQCVRLVLWDESRRRLISFRERATGASVSAISVKTITGRINSAAMLSPIKVRRPGQAAFRNRCAVSRRSGPCTLQKKGSRFAAA